MSERATRLRKAIGERRSVVVTGCHDALSALAVQAAGFEGVQISGFAEYTAPVGMNGYRAMEERYLPGSDTRRSIERAAARRRAGTLTRRPSAGLRPPARGCRTHERASITGFGP